MNILSIDIGILNLGYVYSTLRIDSQNDNHRNKLKNNQVSTESFEIISCDRVDITLFKHSRVPFCDCKLHHDYCIPDYLDHFIQEHSDMFENSDVILIERQPPVGITNVQDLIFSRFRDKVILISPNKIHKYFNMSKDYSKRKEESEKIAEKHLNKFVKYNNNIRKHDISDAMLMLIWYHSIEYSNKQVKPTSGVDFEQFRFLTKK